MLKNAQFKIIVIFFVVGIILIGTLGAFYIYSLENVKMQIATNTVTEVGQVSQEINQIKHNTVISLGIVVIVFAIIGCLISAFLSEFVIYPINKLIKSAEKVTEEDGKNKTKNKKKRNDVDDLERPDGVIAVIQDITEHVKLDNMQKELVADVSHELKTPITSIMGYADTLLEGEYDKETQNKFLNVIATEARRMARLVTDLLTLSRYDSNKKRAQKESFDLGELVKKCQDKLGIEIKKKNHKVNCFVTADVPPVYADKYDIERVVLNILTNSIKYTPDGGEIKIYVGFVYNDAYIKVFDNGIGIPEEDLSRIFERFYRVDKARTREMGGTGLGLSIAKEILDKNGGSIDIKSVVGQGTEVVIRIPTRVTIENEI